MTIVSSTRFAFTVLLIGLFSCSTEVVDPSLPTSVSVDLSGMWVVTVTMEGNCSDESYPTTKIDYFLAEQDGSDFEFSVYPGEETYSGTVDDNTLTWTASLPRDGGERTASFSGRVLEDGDEFKGDATWIRMEADEVCEGTAVVSAVRCAPPTVDFSGVWYGEWKSDGSSEAEMETFDMVVSQVASFLSGRISVNKILLQNNDLSGVVCGDGAAFGDAGQQIVYAGQVDDETGTASGTFTYSSFYTGIWRATRSSSTQDAISVGVSFEMPDRFQPVDLTAKQGWIWLLRDDSILKIDSDGNPGGQLPTPGKRSKGIAAYDDGLLVGDDRWGTGRIYQIGTDAEMFDAMLPGMKSLCFDGVHLWGLSEEGDSGCRLVQFSSNGELMKTVSCSVEAPAGLACDEHGIRIGGFVSDDGEYLVQTLDFEGLPTASFSLIATVVAGMALEGEDLWIATQRDELQRYTAEGDLVQSFTLPDERVADLAFDGSRLWATVGYFPNPRLVALDTDGTIVSEMPSPGESPSGLTFVDGHLWVSDESMDKIFRLSTHAPAELGAIPEFGMTFMTHDGEQLWCIDNDDERIVRIDAAGNVTSRIEWGGGKLRGIAYLDRHLWIITAVRRQAEAVFQLSMTGEVEAEYRFVEETEPEPIGLAHDGEHLWYASIAEDGGVFLNRIDFPDIPDGGL